jgi:DNA-directed RNA polymerase subunit RPC12/RpoP
MKKYVECMPCDTDTYYKESDKEWEQYNDYLIIGYVRCSECGTRIIVGDKEPMKGLF